MDRNPRRCRTIEGGTIPSNITGETLPDEQEGGMGTERDTDAEKIPRGRRPVQECPMTLTPGMAATITTLTPRSLESTRAKTRTADRGTEEGMVDQKKGWVE